MYTKRRLKYIAINLMIIFIFQIAFPTVSLALTGGPSSPETSAFTPVGASELVDLTTGDFSYNIPLMTVPGPNGGYPISIGYKGGVTMEQEASWVGLGWDLSVGSVNRSLRGLPDDFKGDDINQKITFKDNETKTYNLMISALGPIYKKELFGQELSISANRISLSENSYLGWSGGFGLSYSVENFVSGSADWDSKDGISLSAQLSLNKVFDKLKYPMKIGAGWGTKYGFSSINFNTSVSRKKLSLPLSAGVSFVKSAPIGEISNKQDIDTKMLGGGFGTYAAGTPPKTAEYEEILNMRYSKTTAKLKFKDFNVKGYGLLYLESATDNDLMDYHKENTLSSYEYSPTTYLPVLDNDIYNVTGQGISGSFRAFRNDIPMLKPQKVTSTKSTTGFNGSIGVGSLLSLEASYTTGSGKSITGGWGINGVEDGSMASGLEDEIHFEGSDVNQPLYKPFRFEFMGKQTKSNIGYYNSIEKDKPILYPIVRSKRKSVNGMKSKYGKLNYASTNKGIKTEKLLERNITTNHISYRTKDEISTEFGKIGSTTTKYDYIYPENEYPHLSTIDPSFNKQIGYINTIIGKSHHINEISITNTSGTKYVYGLPAYNLEKEDVIFSISPKSGNPKRVTYDAIDASTDNKKGLENYYKSTSIKDYVYSYMLTATYSDDYVDLTNDGPTDDDFGYWCKFNYSKINDDNEIEWRAPFSGASYIKGNYSDSQDDKASYTYGKKQQYYVNSIETKTHIAVFEVGYSNGDVIQEERKDNYGVLGKDNNTPSLGTKTKKLMNIKLYSKKDLATPIKEVVFEHDYSLCPNVENNINTTTETGKLTLKKIYFRHQQNTKGELTPYTFEYGVPGSNFSYDYSSNTDRWGNYSEVPNSGYSSAFFPYTNQYLSKADRDKYASAWNLTKINLPSGGSIEASYESDDYTHIQERRAGQMFELVGFGHPGTDNIEQKFNYSSLPGTVYAVNTKIYFRKTDASAMMTVAEVQDYIKNLEYIYYKTYVSLNKSAEDYISGYFKIDQTASYGVLPDNQTGYFYLEKHKYGGNQIMPEKDIHPIQKAAIQHYHERNDLQAAVQSPIKQIKIRFGGPIKYYKRNLNACNSMSINEKSIIRLNSSKERKYGGGNRVSKVLVRTGWGEAYGQKYNYVKTDGTSSGVADYEPIVGGEENSLKVPVNYNGVLDYNSHNGFGQYFVEKPYEEAFYPGAVVRYARVITESLLPSDLGIASMGSFNSSNLGGTTVNEYYTSRDFPIFESHTKKDKMSPHNRRAIPIPFGLDIPMQKSRANSQGFVIELNDMPGKPKSVSTYSRYNTTSYSTTSDLTTKNMKTKVEYFYHTNGNKLSGDVLVLDQDGDFNMSTIGRKEEFYVHQQEDFDYNKSETWEGNFGAQLSSVDYFVPMNKYDRSIQQSRNLVTNKIIYRTGLLKEVRTNDNGRKTISKNLAYDSYTGEALVQEQINDWNKPVYSYNYAGHWKYPALSGKYKNYRARFKISGASSPYTIDPSSINVEDILHVGDVLENSNGDQVYVTKIDVIYNQFEAKDLSNSDLLVTGDIVTVVNSGYRNLQSIKVGNLVSLDNPLNFTYPNSGFMNDVFGNMVNSTYSSMSFTTCRNMNYTKNSTETTLPSGLKEQGFNVNSGECNVYFSYPDLSSSSVGYNNLTFISGSMVRVSELKYKVKYSYVDGGVTKYGYGILESDCYIDCQTKVLHASATELSDEWTYDYLDLDAPQIKTVRGTGTTIPIAVAANINPYAFGQRGKWKSKRSWVNQVDRTQVGTLGKDSEIDTDGEYNSFVYFKWHAPMIENENDKWAWTNEMTKYSPYGYDLENKNALNIKSSELYGYSNSLVTAVSANAGYYEIAFDDFETKHPSTIVGDNGHFKYSYGTIPSIYNEGHTGKYSLKTNIGVSTVISTDILNLQTTPAKEYIFSAWVKVKGTGVNNFSLNILNSTTLAVLKTELYSPVLNTTTQTNKVIDGWIKMEVKFTPTSQNVLIEFVVPTGYVLVDDIRIHPFNSSFKSYIYNPQTLKLQAELDNLNYATFYNYDEEGKLVQVKKETNKGIVTVKSSRDNIAH